MSPGEKEAVDGAKKVLLSERLWHGKFSPPGKARRSAGFGLKRVVNGRLLKDYYHSGLDFAASLGSPVHACAAGKVILPQRIQTPRECYCHRSRARCYLLLHSLREIIGQRGRRGGER